MTLWSALDTPDNEKRCDIIIVQTEQNKTMSVSGKNSQGCGPLCGGRELERAPRLGPHPAWQCLSYCMHIANQRIANGFRNQGRSDVSK